MRLLLDTHIVLWALVDSPKLSAKARELILSPTNSVIVSAASVWEIAIKHSLGRGDMPISGQEALDYFRQAGYELLPISPEHAAAVEGLPPQGPVRSAAGCPGPSGTFASIDPRYQCFPL